MVLAVVVTAVMYEVGMAVTDPVPVPVNGIARFTLLNVCAVTELPLAGDTECSTGEFKARGGGVVRVSPVVVKASVFISSVWFLSNWLA